MNYKYLSLNLSSVRILLHQIKLIPLSQVIVILLQHFLLLHMILLLIILLLVLLLSSNRGLICLMLHLCAACKHNPMPIPTIAAPTTTGSIVPPEASTIVIPAVIAVPPAQSSKKLTRSSDML